MKNYQSDLIEALIEVNKLQAKRMADMSKQLKKMLDKTEKIDLKSVKIKDINLN